MSTSGFYQSKALFFIDEECCTYTGFVEVIEDAEDMTVHWDCPECGHHEDGELTRDEEH